MRTSGRGEHGSETGSWIPPNDWKRRWRTRLVSGVAVRLTEEQGFRRLGGDGAACLDADERMPLGRRRGSTRWRAVLLLRGGSRNLARGGGVGRHCPRERWRPRGG